ncbi:hypothetical protein L3X38_016476 [Prunus dulcis]|uniref:Copia protein n=1 Tax=Prunus dulcis TaxID=3755 RepID=A0AAD4Z891_PRUDU|nr:hypothetical protein L3X38_016476 [Prunus dulcis]
MDEVVQMLRHLKSAPGKGLMFSKHGHVDVMGHTDSNWAAKGDRRRSTYGYFTFVGENPVQHDRTKHVEIDQNFIYEKLKEKIIAVPYVKTTEQLANMLTKAVSNEDFANSLVKLGIYYIYAPLGRGEEEGVGVNH